MSGRRGKRSYIFEEPIDDESPIIEEIKIPTKRVGRIVETPLLRVRDRPLLKVGKVLKVLQEGDEVTILDNAENNFYKIQLEKDEIGYVVRKLCEEIL